MVSKRARNAQRWRRAKGAACCVYRRVLLYGSGSEPLRLRSEPRGFRCRKFFGFLTVRVRGGDCFECLRAPNWDPRCEEVMWPLLTGSAVCCGLRARLAACGLVPFWTCFFVVRRFEGASDESLQSAVRDALDVPCDWRVILRDLSDASIVAVTASLPSGLRCSAEVKPPATSTPSMASNSDHEEFGEARTNDRAPNSAATRATLLKFERINAHLANERTWLSWVRTALASMTCAFSFLNLTSYDDTWGTTLFVLGSLFVAGSLVTYITGRLRFQRLKTVLSMEYSALVPKFKRFGMAHHAVLFALLVTATCVMYWTGIIEVQPQR